MDALLLNDAIVRGRRLLRNQSTPDALVGRDALKELIDAAALWVESQCTPTLTDKLASRLAQHDGCSRFGTKDSWLLEQIRTAKPPTGPVGEYAIRIFIQDGLVQHVAGPDIPVRVIDLDTEGTPPEDTYQLTKADIVAMPEGLNSTHQYRAFITNYRNGEAVSRG
jgi:hypothetical protein